MNLGGLKHEERVIFKYAGYGIDGFNVVFFDSRVW